MLNFNYVNSMLELESKSRIYEAETVLMEININMKDELTASWELKLEIPNSLLKVISGSTIEFDSQLMKK